MPGAVAAAASTEPLPTTRYPVRMRDSLVSSVAPSDWLQHEAQRAGLALACPYSSSAEFEAAVIRARRRAGAFRVAQVRRYAIVAACMMVAAAATASTYFLT